MINQFINIIVAAMYLLRLRSRYPTKTTTTTTLYNLPYTTGM